jgi:hypothetical protein
MNHWLNEERQILDEKQIDQYNKMEKRPKLGCLIIVGGTIMFWSFVYWVYILFTT